MIFGFGKKSKKKVEDDEDKEELDFVLFQGAVNDKNPDLSAHAKLVQAALVPAKRLVTQALSRRAEMIRLDVKGKAAAATFYIDGVPYPADRMPAQMAGAITQILKLLSGLDVRVRNKPQAGAIKAQYDEKPYEIRVNTQPTPEGAERLIVRAKNLKINLETPKDLGFSESLVNKIREASTSRRGVVVVAGPPFSGVTTALIATVRSVDAYLYSLYALYDLGGKEIIGVNRFQWNEGDDFVQTMHRARREDADVLIVDALTKKEEVAAVLDMSEHLAILAEMPAKDAADAVFRLVQQTGDAALVADRLNLVLSQMLIRLLCKKCRRAYRPNPKLLAKVGLPPETSVLYRPPRPEDEEETSKKGEPEVCDACGGVGYIGRVGLIEALEVSDGMKKIIAAGADPKKLRAQARAERMQSFQSDALRIVVEGNTSLEELQRVFKAQA